MILIACTSCNHALRVTGDMREVDSLVGKSSDYWPNRYPCFHCETQHCHGYLTPEVSAYVLGQLTIIDVTPQEAFAALNGLGVPAERTCCEEVIVPMFEALGIKVKGAPVLHQQRYHIDSLTFPDGTTLHLGTAPQGPVVYRITKPHSYVKTTEESGV